MPRIATSAPYPRLHWLRSWSSAKREKTSRLKKRKRAPLREAPATQLAIGFRAALPVVVLGSIQARQNGCAFLPDGIQARRIEAEDLQDSGGHLSRFHKAVDSARLDARVGDQQYHVGVIVREAAMLGLLLGAAGVNHSDVRRYDDIGRARVAARTEEAAGPGICRYARRVKQGCEGIAIKNLADSRLCRVGFQ